MDILKRFKRIKRKLVNPKTRQQLLNSDGSDSSDPQPTLRFHTVHGSFIRLNSDRSAACRCDSFCNGIVFGNRPVRVNEPICIRFAELSSTWSGTLRFGLTTIDPQSHARHGLPKYACPDLTSQPGHWAKGLPERFAKHDTVLSYWLTESGDIRYAINGQDRGVFVHGLPMVPGLRYWPLLDIYGNVMCVELMDPRDLYHQLNNNYLSVSCTNLSTAHKRQQQDRKCKANKLCSFEEPATLSEKKVLNTDLYCAIDFKPQKLAQSKGQMLANNLSFADHLYHFQQPATIKSKARWVSSHELSLAELSLDPRRARLEDRTNEYIIEPNLGRRSATQSRPLPAPPVPLSKPVNVKIINC